MNIDRLFQIFQLLILPAGIAYLAYLGKKQSAQIAAEPESDKAAAALYTTLAEGARQLVGPLKEQLESETRARAEAELKLSTLEQRIEEMEKAARAQAGKLEAQESQIKQQSDEIKRQRVRLVELEKKAILATERAQVLEKENESLERKLERILTAAEDTKPLNPIKSKK